MFEEIAPEIIQVLNLSKKKVTLKSIVELTGFFANNVIRVLNILEQIGVVEQAPIDNNNKSVVLVKKLTGLQIARLAQLGIDVVFLKDIFNISQKEKDVALEISSITEKRSIIDIKNKKPLIFNRDLLGQFNNSAIKNENILNLIFLLESANLSLYLYLEDLAKKDSKLQLLMELHGEIEKELEKTISR